MQYYWHESVSTIFQFTSHQILISRRKNYYNIIFGSITGQEVEKYTGGTVNWTQSGGGEELVLGGTAHKTQEDMVTSATGWTTIHIRIREES